MPMNGLLIIKRVYHTVRNNRTYIGKIFQEWEGFSGIIIQFRFNFLLEHQLLCGTLAASCSASSMGLSRLNRSMADSMSPGNSSNLVF